LKWKEEKKAKADKERADREKELGIKDRGPKSMMNGREMFVFNPDLFVDDDEAFEEYEKEEEEELDPSVRLSFLRSFVCLEKLRREPMIPFLRFHITSLPSHQLLLRSRRRRWRMMQRRSVRWTRVCLWMTARYPTFLTTKRIPERIV